jgi:hypothetical protein
MVKAYIDGSPVRLFSRGSSTGPMRTVWNRLPEKVRSAPKVRLVRKSPFCPVARKNSTS